MEIKLIDSAKLMSFLAGMVFFCFGLNVHAIPMSFKFTGEVTSYEITGVDPFDGEIGIGSSLDGVFTFNSHTTDADSDPDVGFYIIQETYDYGASYAIESHTFNCCYDSTVVEVQNDISGTDSLLFASGAGVPGVFQEYFNILFTGLDTVFNNDLLPTSVPDIGDYYDASFIYTLLTPTETVFKIGGEIFSINKVPEPATLALMGLGLLGFGFSYRRLQQSLH